MTFWNFRNSTNNSVDLYIVGTIEDEYNWGKEWNLETYTNANDFINELNEHKDKGIINIYINSLGGSVFAACGICNALKRLPATINCYVDGVAASAATIVLMAGDVVYMPVNSMLMIHDPMAQLRGHYSKSDLESNAQGLETVKDVIMDLYMSKVKVSKDELTKMMTKETWLSARKAVDMGFADVILQDYSITYENRNNKMFVNNLDCGHVYIPIESATNNNTKQDIINVSEGVKVIDTNVGMDLRGDVLKERERLRRIDEIASKIDVELVEKAKYELSWTAEKLAYEALRQNRMNGLDAFTNHVNHNRQSGVSAIASNVSTMDKGKILETENAEDIVNMWNLFANRFQKGGK